MSHFKDNNCDNTGDLIKPKTILHYMYCKEQPKDITRMKKILQEDPDSMYRRDSPEYDYDFISLNTYPIHHAILNNHLKCVEFLLQFDKNNADYYDEQCKFNPLLLTLSIQGEGIKQERQNNLESIVELLLKYGASPYVPVMNQEMKGWSRCKYLENATRNSSSSNLTHMLVNHGCNIEDFDIDINGRLKFTRGWEVPVMNTIKFKNFKSFKILLMHGASLYFYYNNSDRFSFSIAHSILFNYKSQIEKGDIDKVIDMLNLFQLHGGNLWNTNFGDQIGTNYNILECLQRQIWFKNNVKLEGIIKSMMIYLH